MYNYSLWTVGWRIFQGSSSSIFLSLEAPSFYYAHEIAPWVTCIVLVACLAWCLMLAWRAYTIDVAIGILGKVT